MTVAYRLVHAAPEALFGVLEDPWTYPSWVVGASRARAVAGEWPRPGAALHHSFGLWPAVIDDRTEIREWNAPRHAVLEAHGSFLGVARVQFDVKPRTDGCVVRMDEDAISGPGMLVPKLLRDVFGFPRTVEALKRLAYLAERKEQP
ncbi:SRPBCC family protein [Gryllotalpicola koreensis]|uniref:SRPBCC family protein n=1 Tax=Gryllotalpicola koreensis TaxID=993086 RepID=A0ABP8AA22_9MICO